MTDELAALGESVVHAYARAGKTIAAAESCTGGWIAKVLTDIPGSSDVFGYGVVSYSNDAKRRLLDVPAPVIETHGAVSEEVVGWMADGVRELSGADVAVAVSGIAGPGGGSDDKPVGTVWFAWRGLGETRTERKVFDGSRDAVRSKTVRHALEGLLARLS
ncbi:MAG: CinA family protein [Pseudomonadota bacterium]